MKKIDVLAAFLVILGALNLGIAAFYSPGLLSILFGDGFLSRLVYLMVGLAGLYQLFMWKSIRRRWTLMAPVTW